MTIKLLYSLHDYGTRFKVNDAVADRVMGILRERNLRLAHATITLDPRDPATRDT
jgi:hypothetical protein